MKTFNDLVFVDETMYDNKVWSRSYMMFDNGYGVSVVKSPTSYGGQSGLYELAVLDDNGFITYGTHITDDVLGFLTPDDVTRHMIEIQELPIKEVEKQTIKRTNKMKNLSLKVARAIAAGTAVLAGLGVIGMMIFSDYATERGLNEYNLLGSLFIFFMGTLYTLAVDAEISRRNTESEAMQKVHLTTLKQCIWMMVALLLLSIPCLFL